MWNWYNNTERGKTLSTISVLHSKVAEWWRFCPFIPVNEKFIRQQVSTMSWMNHALLKKAEKCSDLISSKGRFRGPDFFFFRRVYKHHLRTLRGSRGRNSPFVPINIWKNYTKFFISPETVFWQRRTQLDWYQNFQCCKFMYYRHKTLVTRKASILFPSVLPHPVRIGYVYTRRKI